MTEEEIKQMYPEVPITKKTKDLTGLQFGKLTVLYRTNAPNNINSNKKKAAYWLCKCNCKENNYIVVRSDSLINKRTQSCGCYHSDCAKKHLKKYNMIYFNNLLNKKFGKLTVVSEAKRRLNDKNVYWNCQCDCGSPIIEVRSTSLTSGNTKSCGCISSHGEERISQILTKNKIKYIKQAKFDSCKNPDTNTNFRFDFYLPDYNCCIEYDGKQHFKFTNSGWNTGENYKTTKKYDNIKNQYCANNDIILIRIPYTHYNDLCLDDLLPETSKFIYKGDMINE